MGAYLLGDRPSGEHAARVLSAWFLDPKTRMHPNLEYGQAVRGINTGRGTGLIDTVSMIHASQGIWLLEQAGMLDRSVSDGVRKWYADFLKWMYVNGPAAEQFTPVARYSKADYSMFVDAKQSQSCAGFRRTGNDRRGGYDWIMGGILCAPAGGQMANGQFAQFIERVKLR